MDVVERGDWHYWRDVLAGKREQFVGLIQQGMSNSEACQIVGVNRRAGGLGGRLCLAQGAPARALGESVAS